tara:strand:+ start:734 stop:1345 length:612 start_codon:yes stop_codon:yes gene_type:complete
MSNKIKLKMKRINLQHQFKKAELEEVLDIRQDTIKKFNEDFQKEIEYLSFLSQKKEEEEKEKKKEVRELDEKGKKILKDVYREVVKVTHPDLDKENLYTDEFRSATEYHETQNLPEIVELANDLEIDISKYDIDDEILFSQTEQEVKNLSKKIDDIKSSVGWQWAHAKTDEEREMLKKAFYKYQGISEEQVSNYAKSKGDSKK